MGVGAVALALAGCWYAPGQGPDRTGHNPFESEITIETVGDLTEQWTATTDEGGVQEPIVSNAGAHVVAGTAFYGFNARTGARMWRDALPEPGPPFFAANPISDGNRVLTGRGYGNLGGNWTTRWLDAATGAPVGSATSHGLPDGLRGSTAAFRAFFFGSGTPVANYVRVVDFDDPGAGWSGLVHFTNGVVGAVTLGAEGVYQAGGGMTSIADPANPTIGNGVRSYPLSAPGHCGPGDSFVCPEWATPLDGTVSSAPVLGAGESVLYTATDAGTLYAVDTATGAVLWTTALGAPATGTPALAEGVVYVPTTDGRLVAVDADGCGAATCPTLWSASSGSGSTVREQPAVAGGVVFTGWADGSVHAFDASGCGAATCSPVWSASTGSDISGAPAVTNGQLYVGTIDGRLIAYGLDD